MSTRAETRSPNALTTILFAWLLAGALDITAACVYYPLASGLRVTTLLQGIASGVLGTRAFSGGASTAALGLGFHYLIALTWTVIFFFVFPALKVLSRSLFLTGMVYGIAVWLVMNLIVLPLSNVRHSGAPFNLAHAIVGTVILMFCIGLPIATIVGRYYRRATPVPAR